MKNIAVIGVGGIGRRHLQSLMELSKEMNLYAAEPGKQTLKALKEEFSHGVLFTESIMELPSDIEVAIIATPSNVRRMVFEELVNHANVKYIIFEKVLFQNIDDYYQVESLLNEKGIKAWVNCARREQTPYQSIKKLCDKCTDMTINISGGQWGLACNGIHMLDLIQFLAGGEMSKIDIAGIYPHIVESKRKGFYEFFGAIKGSCGKCNSFQVACFENSWIPVNIDICADTFRVRIDEGKQVMYICEEKNDWEWKKHSIELQYVSQMTAKIVDDIMAKGTCSLPDYEDSMKVHLSYIMPLLHFFKQQGMEEGLCPIT